MEQKKYYLQDIESGHSYEVSKEHYEQYLALWDNFRPKADLGTPVGKMWVFGTRGDIGSGDFKSFEEFYKV